MTQTCRCLNCITPPHILKRLMESRNEEVRQAALSTLLGTERLRGQRSLRATFGLGVAGAPSNGRRSIFDLGGSVRLSDAKLVRTEQGPATSDQSVNRAFDGLGTTRDFYQKVLKRNSIDGMGMRLDGYVHRGRRFNNAFWDGQQMQFGDGDGIIFTDFTGSLDVIAHELTHGVTERTAGLVYHTQSGALNESISDVFGSLVKQWTNDETAEQADWLIGTEIFTPAIKGDALRSLKAPGTAYDNDDLGRDPQPARMEDFVTMPDTPVDDFGGVHINSGIPNKAFHLTAVNIGGNAWEAPGLIWYEALKASSDTAQFQDFADTTFAKAGQFFGAGSREQKAVADAWAGVGLGITSPSDALARARTGIVVRGPDRDAESFAALQRQVESLSDQIGSMARDLIALRQGKPDGIGAAVARNSQAGGERRPDRTRRDQS